MQTFPHSSVVPGETITVTTEGPLDDLTVTGTNIPEDQLAFLLQSNVELIVVNQDQVKLRLSYDMEGQSLVAIPVEDRKVATDVDLELRAHEIAAEHENYLHGSCHIFAIALHRVSGWPLGAALEFDEDIECVCLTHAFVTTEPGHIVDVKGLRSYQSMLDDMPTDESEQVVISEEKLAQIGANCSLAEIEHLINASIPIAEAVYAIALQQIEAERKMAQEQQRQELNQVKYVIRSLSEGDAELDGNAGAFWSNEDGWGSLETATRFTTLERMDSFLPISSGGDSEWMLIEEALDLTRKVSEEEYQQESKRLEAAIAKAKAHLKESCALAEKIERKAAVRAAEESLRQHKLNYFELVDLSQRRSEAMQVTVSTIKAKYGIDDSPSP